LAAAALSVAAPVAPQARADSNIVDVPLEFTVANVNHTEVPCVADGRVYTVRGHLTAPAAQLSAGAVTLYEHGIAAGEWYWRLPVEGYNHSVEMARRGQSSLTIDRLGYDSSDVPDGTAMCVGSQATMAHEIVQDLRNGTYRQPSGKPVPRFGKVAIAGQSNGGQIAQIEAFSFHDVNTVVVMDWADQGLTQQAQARFLVASGYCATGGSRPKHGLGRSGYVYYDQGREEFENGNFHDAESPVLAAAIPHQNQNPCGDMLSQAPGILLDLVRAQNITVPVLGIYGEDDSRVQHGAEHMRLFTSAPETKEVTVPGAGHYMADSRRASLVFDTLADWLSKKLGG
jgi:pimeloyl-ACP methyl ester carboxylesterase